MTNPYKPWGVVTWCRRCGDTPAFQPGLGSCLRLLQGHLGLDALGNKPVQLLLFAAPAGLVPHTAAWRPKPASAPAPAPLQQVPGRWWRRWHPTGSHLQQEKNARNFCGVFGCFFLLLLFPHLFKYNIFTFTLWVGLNFLGCCFYKNSFLCCKKRCNDT